MYYVNTNTFINVVVFYYYFICCMILQLELQKSKILKVRLHRWFLLLQLDAILVVLKLQLQNRTCKPGAIFSAICHWDIAGVLNMFEQSLLAGIGREGYVLYHSEEWSGWQTFKSIPESGKAKFAEQFCTNLKIHCMPNLLVSHVGLQIS